MVYKCNSNEDARSRIPPEACQPWPGTFPEGTAARNAIHLVRARLDRPDAAAIQRFRSLLDEDETSRADRFKIETARRRFVVGRGILRTLLAAYRGIPPESLSFSVGPAGKPSLDGGPEFNVAHSGELLLVAIHHDQPIGVDVEEVRDYPNAASLAAKILPPDQARWVADLPPAERDLALLRGWTRIEALVKARGEGVFPALGKVAVSLTAEEPAHLASWEGEPDAPNRWRLLHLDPAPGFVGALAHPAEGGTSEVRAWDADWVVTPNSR